MSAACKNILLVVLLLQTIQPEAQVINWNNINLVGTEAKILEKITSQPDQSNLLIAKIFDTKEGKITVYMPPLSHSASISGTVYIKPTGKDSSKNLIALQSYSLSLGHLIIPVQRGSFQFTLPADPSGGMISLQLKNNAGQIIKTEQLPVTKTSVNSNDFIIPPYIVSGDQTIISGNFDGNITNSSVKINGEKTELLAESPSRIYFTSKTIHAGNVTVVCSENGKTQTSTSNQIKLSLSVDKTNLRQGQQTQFHIKITGLEGLKKNVPVTITNTSPSVISLEGGNTQQITVEPGKDAPSGIIELTRNIQSLKNGSFSVSVNITPFSSTFR